MKNDSSDKHFENLGSRRTAQQRKLLATNEETGAELEGEDKIDALAFLDKARSYIRKAHELAAK